MKRFALLNIGFFATILVHPQPSFSQNKGKPTWLDMMRQEHNKTRFGVGVKAGEPSGFVVQLFKGTFCSSDNHYIHHGTVEFFGGVENRFLSRNYQFKGGKWAPGGSQFGISYQNQLPGTCLIMGKLTVQLHGGIGFQGGNRRFVKREFTEEAITYGGLGFLRLSFTGKGFKAMNRFWFWSFFAEEKYYQDFTQKFSYWRPAFGLIFRNVR
jgi:hypothetical protein